MSILLHFIAISLFTGFFLGIYQFYDKSLDQSETIKNSFILVQSTKLKNAQIIQVKYKSTYILYSSHGLQKVINLHNYNKFQTKLSNDF